MNNILLAGGTGYLGKFVLYELLQNGYHTKVIVRRNKKFEQEFVNNSLIEIINAELTKTEAVIGCCKNIDTVISTVGITKQKDGLTYMDVDYQANLNLLEEAKQNGVKKFIYVSVLNGPRLKHLKICEAKEKFVEALKQSGLDYCIIRPNGFFSDMTEFFNMAENGRIYLFGNGEFKSNPIHGEDLAKVIIDAINTNLNEIDAGGPQTLTQNQIAEIAFKAAGKFPKITYIPNWLRIMMLNLIRIFTSSKTYGPVEFFLTVMAMDMVAPELGHHSLEEYFNSLEKINVEKSVL